jgi:hypothetical protein
VEREADRRLDGRPEGPCGSTPGRPRRSIVHASDVEALIDCGRQGCACATDPDSRHAGKFLTVFVDDRTQGFHLRAEDEEYVRGAVAACIGGWERENRPLGWSGGAGGAGCGEGAFRQPGRLSCLRSALGWAHDAGVPIAIVNATSTPYDRDATVSLAADVGATLVDLVDALPAAHAAAGHST